MTFAKKLYLLLATATLGMIALGSVSFMQISTVFEAANYANVNSLPSIEQIDNVTQALFRMRVATWKHLATADTDEKAQDDRDIAAAERSLTEALTRYEKEDVSDAQDQQLLDQVKQALGRYYSARDRVLKLSSQGNYDEGRKELLGMQAVIAQAENAIMAHRSYNHKLAEAGSQRAEAEHQKAVWLSLLITLTLTAAICIGGALLVKRLINALREAIALADTVASGDLTRKEVVTSDDEIGQLQRALNTMSDKLNNIIGEVQNGAAAIRTASGEIANGNMDLSVRTEQQAGTLEETAASLEELTGTVQNNSENTTEARRLAEEAAQTAREGGEVVAQVVATMAAINASSTRIVDIISVIDGLSFQTNILALNAAVEAARAGEEGRGFAVVASEVRTLAQRSAAAAKEIKTLIDDSVAQVNQGGALVNQAGSTMEHIVSGIHQVAQVIADIADAGMQQSAGLHQINQAMSEMDTMTQQNAALVEQSAAAATAMNDQAHALSELIGHFTLRSQQVRLAPVRHTAPVSARRLALSYSAAQ